MTESAAIIRVPGLDFYRDWVAVTQITISRTGFDWQVLVCKSHWQSWGPFFLCPTLLCCVYPG